jgi:hypothetical protein
LVRLRLKFVDTRFWKTHREEIGFKADDIMYGMYESETQTLLLDKTAWRKNPSLRNAIIRHEICHALDPWLGKNGKTTQLRKDFITLLYRRVLKTVPNRRKARIVARKVADGITNIYPPHERSDELRANIAYYFPEELVMPTTRSGLFVARFMRAYKQTNDAVWTTEEDVASMIPEMFKSHNGRNK